MTCRTCQHWQMKANPEMARQGFARCAHGERWKFWPPGHVCERFKPAEAKAIEMRDKVLKGIGA